MTPQPSEPRTAAGRSLLAALEQFTDADEVFTDGGLAPILAIEAEAAAPDPVASPLDVERLARALATLDGGQPVMVLPVGTKDRDPDLPEHHHAVALRIAAAYARLEGQPVAEEPE